MSSSSSAGRQPEQGLKCPRCDSPNTKFCYYNNYSLSQPRHFCKTCRRYWTRGGVLRNVPVGGGCRKNKKSKSPASSRIAFNPIETFAAPPPPAAAMASTCAFGFNGNTHSSIASSIESLSSVNQELHWKLQQQRLQAVYFGGEGQNESCVSTSSLTTQQTGPLSFVATDHTIPAAAAAWFPETTSYFLLPNTTSTSAAATTTNNNINNNSSSSSNNNNNNSGNWNGIPGWIDMPQFTTLLP